jgi:hypothetical protein
MKYQLLSQDEQDEIQASFLLGQERDLFCHELNAARYTKLLKNIPEGEWKKQIEGSLKDTLSRIDQVTRIINASALPSQERLATAKARLEGKAAKGA